MRRLTESERKVRRCSTHWAQRGLPEHKIEELSLELEDGLREAAECGYPPEAVTGADILEFAEQQAKENEPPRRRRVAAFKLALIALVSACAVLVPQHVLLGSWAVAVGWTEILAVAAIFSVIALLQWHRFSSRTYNGGRRADGVFLPGDVWFFAAGVVIGCALRVYDSEPASTKIIEWPWWASALTLGFALLASRLHARSKTIPVSPRLSYLLDAVRGESGSEPRKSGRLGLWPALITFGSCLAAWLLTEGLLRDLAGLMFIASSLLLAATALPAFGRRDRGLRPSEGAEGTLYSPDSAL
jgi:hypothetical protein